MEEYQKNTWNQLLGSPMRHECNFILEQAASTIPVRRTLQGRLVPPVSRHIEQRGSLPPKFPAKQTTRRRQSAVTRHSSPSLLSLHSILCCEAFQPSALTQQICSVCASTTLENLFQQWNRKPKSRSSPTMATSTAITTATPKFSHSPRSLCVSRNSRRTPSYPPAAPLSPLATISPGAPCPLLASLKVLGSYNVLAS